jgi:hypothetical protein
MKTRVSIVAASVFYRARMTLFPVVGVASASCWPSKIDNSG